MKLWTVTLMLGVLALSGCGEKADRLPKREHKYLTLNKEVLDRIPDKELEAAIMDYVEFKIGDDYEHEYKTVTGLSKGFQAIYCTSWIEAEVYNGGFNQYFWNYTGQFRQEALEGYKLIGAQEHADIVQEALKIYDQQADKLKKFKAKDTRESFSESYKDNPLNACDDKFYKLKSDIGALRVKFIREHPDLFVGT